MMTIKRILLLILEMQKSSFKNRPLQKVKRLTPQIIALSLYSVAMKKLFTSLLSEILHEYVDENVILKENQAGFRKKYSTLDHIFTLHALTEIMNFEKKSYSAHT